MRENNIKLVIQYDGMLFSGYAVQPGKRTVKEEIEKALHKIFKKKIKINATSRTDSGVHALSNIISFNTKTKIPIEKLPMVLNSVLPDDVRVASAKKVPKSFNARFSPKSKTYEYLIYNGGVLPPQFRNFVWHVKPKINLAKMRKASKYLVGKHDFSSFCAAGSDDINFIKKVHSFDICHLIFVIWGKEKIKLIKFKIKGDGFLYRMVRNIVGTMVDVGIGRIKPEAVKEILKAKDRKKAGRCAPGHGLCLVNVSF